MADFGYDRVIFSVIRDDTLPSNLHKLGLVHNYPTDWQAHYAEQKFYRIDPVLRLGQATSEPFLWSSIGQRFSLNRNQIKFMRLGMDVGLHNGVGIPLHLNTAARAGIALASSSLTEKAFGDLDILFGFALQFYRSFRSLYRAPPEQVPITPLSVREEQCLALQLEGLRDPQIAERLGVSLNTIETVNRRILAKMERPTRAAALGRAVLLNILKN